MAVDNDSSLLSSSKTSDSRLTIQLHPLVLLTISDYITRHTLRGQQGPIVGAIVGAQHGRNITMEHAFECKLDTNKDNDVVMDDGWFLDRLQQYRDVHKAPALDLVGWFTLGPPSGPQPHHVPIHRQLLEQYNESVLLLTFHPTSVADDQAKGGKLPLTVYESVSEGGGDDNDKQMQESGEGPHSVMRFKELPYSVETAEAEMIAVDFVARGGANATTQKSSKDSGSKGKGKSQDVGQDEAEEAVDNYLSPEDDDMIATLTAKGNAIRMLQQRLSLIRKYLASVPSCYLNDASKAPGQDAQLSHSILRSVASLLARLPLLTPSTPADGQAKTSVYAQESAAEASDVALVSLLGSLGYTLDVAQGVGKKSSVVEQGKSRGKHNAFEAGLPAFGDMHGGGTGGIGTPGADRNGFEDEMMNSDDGHFATER